MGKLNLVDLAGSERQSKTHAEGQRLKEVPKLYALSVVSILIAGWTHTKSFVNCESTHFPWFF